MRSKHDTSSPSAAKAPTSKAKLRRFAEPFTLFKIHEFDSKADSDCFASISNILRAAETVPAPGYSTRC
jgi:hypothetical protein